MPWSGGTYTRGYPSWTNDANANLPISATKFDVEDNDFASGISFCLNKDGSSTPTGPLTWAQALTVASIAVTGNTPAVNGMYLAGGTSLSFSTASTQRGAVDQTGHWGLAVPTSGATQVLDLNVNNGSFSATANAAFRIINTNPGAQTAFDWFSNGGVLTGRVRNDFNGNMAYVSELSGIHSFYVGGDSGAGVQVTSVVSQANGGLQAIDQGGTIQTVGWRDCPQNLQSAGYTCVLGDRGKAMMTVTGGITFTIPANASVAYPQGTVLTFCNTSGSNISISINSDIMILAGTGGSTTGTRTLANGGVASAIKVQAAAWLINGAGLS